MKRNSLMKRFAAGVLAFSLIIPAVPVNAQVSYDATAGDGIRIDTSLVPSDKNISITNGVIKSNKNLHFKLECTVDAEWSIEPSSSTDNIAAQEVGDTVKVDKVTGEVFILDTAAGGHDYTIKANPQNVTVKQADSITIHVNDSTARPAPEDIYLSEEMNEPGRVEVTDNGKTLNLYGKVTNKELIVKTIPDYYVDDKIDFANRNSDNYYLNSDKITSKKPIANGALGCTFGSKDSTKNSTDFKVVINEEKFSQTLKTDDIAVSDADNNEYILKMNQYVVFTHDENSKTALFNGIDYDINNVEWTFVQNAQVINPIDDDEVEDLDGDGKDELFYPIKDTAKERIGTIIVFSGLVDGHRQIHVMTDNEENEAKIPAVTIKGKTTFKGSNKSEDKNVDEVTLRFNNNQVADFSGVKIDFEKAGYVKERDFVVKQEKLENNMHDVYYFETSEDNAQTPEVIDFIRSTFSKISGVNTFEISKDQEFKEGSKFRVYYEMTDVSFDSTKLKEKYNNNNTNLKSQLDDNKAIKDPRSFKKYGIGYKKLTVRCTENGNPIGDPVVVYLRFVTSADNLEWFGVAIKNAETGYYDYEETVHVTKGEAIIPYIFSSEEKNALATGITIYNPYVTIELSDSSVARVTNTSVDSGALAGTYKISGVKSGRIMVTLRGVVRTDVERSFVLYVNKDSYQSSDGYQLNFDQALAGNMINEDYEITGRYSAIPIDIESKDASGGVPDVYWYIDCSETVATIDHETGTLTTKLSSDTKIKISALLASDHSKTLASRSVSILEVSGEGIDTIAETDATSLVKTTDEKNKGTCNVGDEFTLCAATYTPANANYLKGTITWESDNPEIAKIESTTGKVKALSKGTVRITAKYVSQGKAATPTEFVLNVEGVDNPITGISVDAKKELTRIGDTIAIDAKSIPENATNGKLKYESSDVNIATVNESGLITAVAVGKCEVKVYAEADSKIYKIVEVTVGGNPDKATNAQVEETINLINSIGTVTVDDASKAKIDAARAAYNELTEEQKNAVGVTALNTLTTAESTYSTAKAAADKAAADKAAADKAAADKAAADKAAADAAAQAKADEDAAKGITSVKAKIKVAKNLKGKKIKVGVSAITNAKGYQIKYSTKKNMKSSKTKNITKANVTLTKLKKGKTYYIQARGYSEYNGTKYYSKWSAKKKVKVNK